MAAVKLGGKGDVTKSHRLWEREGVGADVPSPIIHKGKVYNLSDKGKFTALDLKTGKELWSHQFKARGKEFYSSPILAGDLVYILRNNATLHVCRLTGNGLEELDSKSMGDGDGASASVVPVNNVILVRTFKTLTCFGN